jgi:hypothetical protein
MKKYLFLLLAAIFCLPVEANPPFNHYLQPTGAEGTNVAHEQFLTNRRKAKLTKYQNKTNKGYASYVNRIQQENQAYLDAKTSAEITVDEATGTTTIKWNDGAAYQGQTYYGEIKGIGTMVYPDKSKYVGSWERDLPNGQGTFQTPEGIMYTVNFENGVPHGKGIIQDLDGRKYSARWVRGVLKEKSIKPLKEKK